MDALIKAENLHVIRRKKSILHNINITLNAQDFVTVIGPNGAGKSMLIKCLVGIHKPDSGLVTRQQGLTLGYVPQNFALNGIMPITVERFLKLHKHASKTELMHVAEETHIDHHIHKPLAELSGGELQRVLLARSLLGNPELLVLDEPAQNLDVSGQLAFYKLLERIYKERLLSVLMISHDLHMVMASTKRVICLFHHICCSGEPQTVAKDPEFIDLFGHDMARMMAIYQHSHNHTHEGDINV